MATAPHPPIGEQAKELLEKLQSKDLSEPKNVRVADESGVKVVRADGRDVTSGNESEGEKIFAKVARFLNPKTDGPVYALTVRRLNAEGKPVDRPGKVFFGRLLTSSERVSVSRLAAMKVGEALTSGELLTAMIGELTKGMYGWLPENSPKVDAVKAQLDSPEKWPKLNECEWVTTRDPYVENEIDTLWKLYLAWKREVVPTEEEMDFYYSRMT